MFRLFLLLILWAQTVSASPPALDFWQRALPGARYQFPADHESHLNFKTEWWYFTGTLKTRAGREYGYELTFFRQGVLPPSAQASRLETPVDARSKFVQNDFKFAHFAITDLNGRQFLFTQKINRGVFGEAGFGHPFTGHVPGDSANNECLAWIDEWSLKPLPNGSWKIVATTKDPTEMAIDLEVAPAKSPVIEGVDGVSQKSVAEGDASYYYSYTRLETRGTMKVGDDSAATVEGESWFDHEWASNQLAPDQVGWNWFCFQFDDQTEMMLYAMRRRDGSIDPVSSGTWVAADGQVEHLKSGDYTMRPTRSWHSGQTGATYPLAWQIELPSHRLKVEVQPKLDTQELVLPPISYWEGAMGAAGTSNGAPIRGHGYMELTGYAGALKGLQEKPSASDPGLRAMPR